MASQRLYFEKYKEEKRRIHFFRRLNTAHKINFFIIFKAYLNDWAF